MFPARVFELESDSAMPASLCVALFWKMKFFVAPEVRRMPAPIFCGTVLFVKELELTVLEEEPLARWIRSTRVQEARVEHP